ncbi:MAG: type 4a pilus biogenesis protein PilO [Candidatus Marinimicrobia bacterium]|nr:type 4a pilus biogenesis protein PilO [Candidatus Neomarinimicrobiota bacterium]MCH7764185.1 type 4a pilus biogenesis protein PilO [Candidatus Neomarinimicrobiota bacterium]
MKSNKNTFILIIILLTISTGLWIWTKLVIHDPAIQTYSQQLKQLNLKFNELEGIRENMPKIQDNYNLSGVDFDTLKNQIYDNRSYIRILEQIRDLAGKHQVEIKSFSPNLNDSYPTINTFLTFNKKHIERYPVQVRVFGQFLNISVFLEEILNLPTMVNIHSLKMETELTNGGSLSCDLVFYTYMFIEDTKAAS